MKSFTRYVEKSLNINFLCFHRDIFVLEFFNIIRYSTDIYYFFWSAIMDCLVLPLQEKLEDWRKSLINLDKEHAKGYYNILISYVFREKYHISVTIHTFAVFRIQKSKGGIKETLNRYSTSAKEESTKGSSSPTHSRTTSKSRDMFRQCGAQ